LFSVRITVLGSGVATLEMLSNTAFFALLVEPSALARSKLNFTAAESNGVAVLELHALAQVKV
jgi:16S rRNA G966 N2-methylase RsmD